jgi:hypothetical protein
MSDMFTLDALLSLGTPKHNDDGQEVCPLLKICPCGGSACTIQETAPACGTVHHLFTENRQTVIQYIEVLLNINGGLIIYQNIHLIRLLRSMIREYIGKNGNIVIESNFLEKGKYHDIIEPPIAKYFPLIFGNTGAIYSNNGSA